MIVHLVAMCIRLNLSRIELKELTDWFGCTDYLLPAEKKLHTDLASAILEHCRPRQPKARSNYLFDAWYLSDIAQDMLTQKQQIAVAEILTVK